MSLYHKFAILFFTSFFTFVGYLVIKSNIEYRNYNFKGRLQHIVYGTKGGATIVVNNKEFHLGPNPHFKKKVKIGDSIIKKAGTTNILVINEQNEKMIFKF